MLSFQVSIHWIKLCVIIYSKITHQLELNRPGCSFGYRRTQMVTAKTGTDTYFQNNRFFRRNSCIFPLTWPVNVNTLLINIHRDTQLNSANRALLGHDSLRQRVEYSSGSIISDKLNLKQCSFCGPQCQWSIVLTSSSSHNQNFNLIGRISHCPLTSLPAISCYEL